EEVGILARGRKLAGQQHSQTADFADLHAVDERVERRRSVLVGHLHGLRLRLQRDPARRVTVAAVAVINRVDEQFLEDEVEQQADKLVTGADGTVGVTFTDNSLLSVGPNSVLAIDRYVFDSTTHAGQFDSTLSKGTLAVISGKIVKQSPDAMHVRTPSAIMGVRGTEFIVRVDR